MKTKLLTPNDIQGKQFGYRSSAMRVINKYCTQNPIESKKFIFAVNQIDEGCFEIDVSLNTSLNKAKMGLAELLDK